MDAILHVTNSKVQQAALTLQTGTSPFGATGVCQEVLTRLKGNRTPWMESWRVGVTVAQVEDPHQAPL